MDSIYLDNNATTAIHPQAAEAMLRCSRDGWGNPASQHGFGRRARHLIEDARDAIVEILGGDSSNVQSDRLVFTSGGTESNNLAIRGLGGSHLRRLIVSAIEHPSVLGAAKSLQRTGSDIVRLPANPDGLVSFELLDGLITSDTRLVSVMLGNNETGVLQPVAELASITHRRGVPFYTDAVQVVGKVPVHFRQLGVDALGFAAHKFHGPVGIGGLLLKQDVDLRPVLMGGFQQYGMRPGTEPVPLVVGMHAALNIWRSEASEREARLRRLRDRLLEQLRAGHPNLVVHGEPAPRLPQTLSVSFPGVDRQALVMALDMVGIACSTGSACASGSSEPSAVLLAMGVEERVLASSVRFSISALTTEQEIDTAGSRILSVINDLSRRLSAADRFATPRGTRPKTL